MIVFFSLSFFFKFGVDGFIRRVLPIWKISVLLFIHGGPSGTKKIHETRKFWAVGGARAGKINTNENTATNETDKIRVTV